MRSGSAIITGRALWASRASGSLWAGRTLGSGSAIITGRALGTGSAGRSSGTLSTRGTIVTCRALWASRPRIFGIQGKWDT
ncbi:MAG: hypothetical protein EBZ62_04925 [Sphingobacteriia bacterium]|nr:hypothetical protein [Sphingobacteriia bacterium]